eukprot:5446127-Pyramimonas_sp.AAC.1
MTSQACRGRAREADGLPDPATSQPRTWQAPSVSPARPPIVAASPRRPSSAATRETSRRRPRSRSRGSRNNPRTGDG